MNDKWIALSVTTKGPLMAGIDTRILIVGLPTVARDPGADVESIIGVSQSYLLANTIGCLPIGRITDVIGMVKICNIGFANGERDDRNADNGSDLDEGPSDNMDRGRSQSSIAGNERTRKVLQ
jgi:hypothetical protein